MDQPAQEPGASPKSLLLKLGVDLGPLIVFFATNAAFGIFAATAAFMVSFFVALGVSYTLEKKLAVMPIVTGAIVLVFGGLTLYLNDETFIKLKPTIIYALFSVLLLGGLAAGRPLIRVLFGPVFHLDERGWRALTLRWGVFFAALAGVNEIARNVLSTNAWVAFKLWGFLPLTVLFTIAQTGLIRRHSLAETPPNDDSST